MLRTYQEGEYDSGTGLTCLQTINLSLCQEWLEASLNCSDNGFLSASRTSLSRNSKVGRGRASSLGASFSRSQI